MMQKKLFIMAFSIFCLMLPIGSLPAAASDSPQNEIIYRTNLGRAADVELLLKKGASPNGRDSAGVPLLALAASRDDDEGIHVLQALVDAGADLNARDAAGQTPLFYAVKQDNMKAVEYLLSKGANYYAQDAKGYTARDFAYTSGHEKIGAAIDGFIKKQSEERVEQYKQYNETIAERLKSREALPPAPVAQPIIPKPLPQAEFHPVAFAKHPVAAMPSHPRAMPVQVLTPEEKAAQQAATKKREGEISRMEHDLAFNACAFQYWSYVDQVGENTELSTEALDEAVDNYQNKASALENQLVDTYHLKAPFVKDVSHRAQRRIFMVLAGMHSNSNRFEQGVGKKSDMESRCKEVERRWDWALPAPPPPRPRRGGIGVMHYHPHVNRGAVHFVPHKPTPYKPLYKSPYKPAYKSPYQQQPSQFPSQQLSPYQQSPQQPLQLSP